MINVDLNNVSAAGDYVSIKEGGYVGVIEDVVHMPDKQGIVLWLDIAEGECAGYYADLYDKREFWGLSDFRSYKEKALPFFKRFVDTVEACNARYRWNGDESKLKGKKIGMVLKKTQYTKNDGSIGFKFVVDKFIPLGEVKKYPLRDEAEPVAPGFVNVTEEKVEGIPFH